MKWVIKEDSVWIFQFLRKERRRQEGISNECNSNGIVQRPMVEPFFFLL